jgi:bacterioferritin-associated ferredoxin
MDACHSPSACQSCPGRVVCHCLQVTEEMLIETLSVLPIRTLRELRQATGAGEGCTACHHRLRNILEQQLTAELAHASSSSSPI